MEPSDKLWNRINQFLGTHTFDLEWTPPGAEDSMKFNTKFKMELVGKKIYRQVNDKEYIEYRLYILPSGGGSDIIFSAIKDLAGERTLTAESGAYYMIVRKTNDLLSDTLIYFGIENPLVCTEVVNLVD
jgi:hypothetical protein